MISYVNRQQEIFFKDTRIRPMLRVVTLLACEYCYYKFGVELFVFSTYREGDGVHGLWRAADLDNGTLNHTKLKEIESYINWLFTYDPERSRYNVCWYHTSEKIDKTKGWHLHLQVHPNTRMSEPAIY